MKAILVIDMPSSCTMCRLDRSCKVWNDEPVKFKGYNDRIDGCPLRPMPDRAAETLISGLDAIKNMESIEVRKVIRTE